MFYLISSILKETKKIGLVFSKCKLKSFDILQIYCKIHLIFFFKHAKIFYIFFEKDAKIILDFYGHMHEKKITIIIFRICLEKNPIFSSNKTTQNKLKGCLSKTHLNPKKNLHKNGRTKWVQNPSN